MNRSIHCECGEILGDRCNWSGPLREMVTVEYMPESLRDSHEAAGNHGSYPANGSHRIRCERSCAERLIHEWEDGEMTERLDPWIRVVGGLRPSVGLGR